MKYNAATLIDCYKFGHIDQAPKGITRTYSNLTPRGSRVAGVESVVVFGIQAFLHDLEERFETFFNTPLDEVLLDYYTRKSGMLGDPNASTDHIEALHRLGYLPLEFRALPEGMECPLRIPVLTVENTHDDFAWLTNYIETILSAETWHPMTSATTALHFRRLLDEWAYATSDIPEFVDWQGHDFSFRGLGGLDMAAASGAAHLLSFAGTDTVPALDWIEWHYTTEPTALLGASVPATEHSVMCEGGKDDEYDTYARLLEIYPSGIVSVVSDTWDFWGVITDYLPRLKDKIMARDGKLVIRPDSGNPADILTGTAIKTADGLYDHKGYLYTEEDALPEHKGLIELLWEIFGGTVNSKGYKQLDPHIGAIYGDSITYERAADIMGRLEKKGFASTNVVFGIGSYTYQYVTRDTYGFAMKATWAEIDGEGVDLFKDPKTDNGLKKSARGRLGVFMGDDGKPFLVERASWTDEESPDNLLQVIWRDGEPMLEWTWAEVVDRVGVRYLK